MKSFVLEKALKTRNGSVQDALAGIPRLSDSQPLPKTDSSSSDDRDTSPCQVSSQKAHSTVNTSGLSEETKTLNAGKKSDIAPHTIVKPCCQRKPNGNASAKTMRFDAPSPLSSTTSNIPQVKEQTTSLFAIGDSASAAVDPSGIVANSSIPSALPSAKKAKHEHHEQPLLLDNLSPQNVTLPNTWASNATYPAVSSLWHQSFQPDISPMPQQNPMEPFMVAPQISNHIPIMNPPLQHQCDCGETCQCLGCAQHPTNTRTTDYVRDTVKYMFTDEYGETCFPNDRIPTGQDFRMRRPSQIRVEKSRSGGSAARKMRAFNLAAHVGSMEDLSSARPLSQAANQYSSTIRPAGDSMTLASMAEDRHDTFSRGSNGDQQEAVADDGYDVGLYPPLRRIGTDNNSDDLDCLSPSAFYLQQFVIPGCSDMTGACLCGDGCTCVGCLTHNGHNGYIGQDGLDMGFSAMPTTTSSASPSYYHANANPMARTHTGLMQNGDVWDTSVPG